MASDDQIKTILDLLASAEANIKSARNLLGDTSPSSIKVSRDAFIEQAGKITPSDTSGKIIEGVFDGQAMLDKEGNIYPVPANYASKSKLIAGDVLKLTITDEGRFIYKQIKPIPRKSVVGPLINEDGQYRVLAEGKSYKVLLASVTYFRANVGDEVTLVIPEGAETEWGAIEAIIPKFENKIVDDNGDATEANLDDDEDDDDENQ